MYIELHYMLACFEKHLYYINTSKVTQAHEKINTETRALCNINPI